MLYASTPCSHMVRAIGAIGYSGPWFPTMLILSQTATTEKGRDIKQLTRCTLSNIISYTAW